MPITAVPYSSQAYHACFAAVVPLTPQEFFDHQVETLVNLGVITAEDADPFVGKVPAVGYSLANFKNFPASEFGRLMGLVKFEEKAGRSYLAPEHHTNVLTPPDLPYLLTGIEDGRARLNVEPSVSERNIAAEGRKGYLTLHGIYHTLSFSDIFESHYMDLVGSRYESGYVPDLCLVDGGPGLRALWYGSAYAWWGAPSCAEWLVL